LAFLGGAVRLFDLPFGRVLRHRLVGDNVREEETYDIRKA
jgi:hypothetical protein